MHEVLVNRLGGLSLPRKSVVRLTDRPDMTLDVYRGRKTTMQQQQQQQHGPRCLQELPGQVHLCIGGYGDDSSRRLRNFGGGSSRLLT